MKEAKVEELVEAGNCALTPKEVIDDIQKGYMLGVNEASTLHEMLDNAIRLLSIDLYSKDTHFVLELIQNADDNDYSKGKLPELTFKVFPDHLVLINNEDGFQEKHVRALCQVGKSSKARKSGYIGEKGIGFKSVFKVSNAPEVHSNGYHFKFDRSSEENTLGYVVPTWSEPPPDWNPDFTTIVLPAIENGVFRNAALETLDATLLLFLSKLRRLSVDIGSVSISHTRSDEASTCVLHTESKRPDGDTSTKVKRYVRVSYSVDMAAIDEPKRPDANNTEIVLAFPVDRTASAAPSSSCQVFAFLPIRPFGFKFAIQADFVVNASREDIHVDMNWNQRLRDSIAAAFVHALNQFKNQANLAKSYLKYLPTETEISDPFFKPVVGEIYGLLAKSDCLLSVSQHWCLPSGLRIAEKKFQDLFPTDIAKQLFGGEYLHPQVKALHEVLRRLGVKSIGPADIVGIFESRGAWLTEQPNNWKAKFYAYLADQDIAALLRAGLAAAFSVPVSGKGLVRPSIAPIFFPLGGTRKYGFEHELSIVDETLFVETLTLNPKVEQLFEQLGLRRDNPYELVNSHILPRHAKDDWKQSDHKALVGHVRYIKATYKSLIAHALEAGQTEAAVLANFRTGLWIGSKQQEGATWFFSRVSGLYLSKEFKPSFCVESLLGSEMPLVELVSEKYLGGRKDKELDAQEWRDFFEKLGIRVSPNLIAYDDGDWGCSRVLKQLLQASETSARRATLECLDQHWEKYADKLTYVLRRSGLRLTLFAQALRQIRAPTKKRSDVLMSQAYYKTPLVKELFADRVTYVDAQITHEALLMACGVTYKIDAGACFKRLRQLKTEKRETTPQLQAIYRALEKLWSGEAAVIKNTFQSEALICVRGEPSVWKCSGEVSWKSNDIFMDRLYPPLQPQYRDFSTFFTDKIGVPRELPTEKAVRALSRLDEIDDLEFRKRVALSIYRRASRDLAPRFGKQEVMEPDWLDVFENEHAFVDHRGDMQDNHSGLFVSDVPEWEPLFTDAQDISFLAVPYEDLPRVDNLVDRVNVPRLSAAVGVQVANPDSGTVNIELTQSVRQAVLYLARVVYSRSPETLEYAMSKGLFAKLTQVQILEVSDLTLDLILNELRRTCRAPSASNGTNLFIEKEVRAPEDFLARELCGFLGVPYEMADLFALILMQRGSEERAEFLIRRRIANLPADIEAGLMQLDNSESDGVADSASLDDDLNPSEEQQLDATEPRDASDGEGIDASGTTGPVGGNGAPPSGGTGINGTDAPAPGVSAPPPGTNGTRTSGPTRAKHGTGNPGAGTGNPGAGTGNPGAGTGNPGAGTGSRGTTSGNTGAGVGNLGAGRGRRGRLISYVSSNEDTTLSSLGEDDEDEATRMQISRAAVDYFMMTAAHRWKLVTEMPHNNPGFDIKAIDQDGAEEVVEVKGQSGEWSEAGVVVTPTELAKARELGTRYWLCVVEYALEPERRQLYLVNNPYGQANEFRFDCGWKQAADK